MQTFDAFARPSPATPTRLWPLDALRGVALVAMFVFHFTWDLSNLRLIELDPTRDPAWMWFARIIASSFLVLVGIGLVMAHGRGLKAAPFLRRLAMIAAAAALVTIGTYLALPGETIWFGILHCVVVSSILGLAFLRLPALVTLAIGVACIAAPAYLSANVFNADAWYWLGLRTAGLRTADYVPILPFFGLVLFGIALGRIGWPQRLAARLGKRAPSAPERLLALGGRHSLAVYLIHQPVFFGVLWAAAALAGPSSHTAGIEFRQNCRAQCAVAGAAAATCQTYCACAETQLRKENLWRQTIQDDLPDDVQPKLAQIIGICRREAGIPLKPVTDVPSQPVPPAGTPAPN